MTLAVGARIGPYEVLSPLGRGGMGEVYRARDGKLNRDVALKILPEDSAADPERLARFKREAQVLAALNHPHIGSIYGFEDSGSLHALVLELVEGPTLADRISAGALPITEVLVVARQIADALRAAHEQGVIHRDLKPANIKLRNDGAVKVLDFGLAKLVRDSESESQPPGLSLSPTVTRPAQTRLGVIMGTTTYMSPEQTRGVLVEKQTDVWAFGCVLYEMLTGRNAFAGETFSDTIATILTSEPDWHALPTATPALIRNLLRRCLEKDPHRRLHDIADARSEIDKAIAAMDSPHRLARLPVAAAAVFVMLAATAVWYYVSRPRESVQPAPVSVIIADFDNRTSDPAFDRTLEPLLRIVLEGAGFVTAYDRNQLRTRLGVLPPDRLTEVAARELAVKQGLSMVFSGSIDDAGTGYGILVKATQALTGNVIVTAHETVPSKDQVLSVATKLVTSVREALGDDTSDLNRLHGMTSLSATSLEVARDYALAQSAASNGKFEEALQHGLRAVEIDPAFGIGYQILAAASRNLGRLQDAQKYIGEALRHLDGMTARERYSTRGLFYRLTGDYKQCVTEYGEMIATYASDVVGHNQRALCLSYLRDMRGAVDGMRRVVEIVPKRVIFRVNLALYSNYAGDFETGEREAQTARQLALPGSDSSTLLPLAFSQLGQEQIPRASETYSEMTKIDALGVSLGASGLADVAVYEGRFSDAVRVLSEGAARDVASKSPDRAAAKFAALASTELLRRQKGAAAAAAERALRSSNAVHIRFLVARVFVEAGDIDRAKPLIASLASELQAEPQAYAKIVDAEVSLQNGNPREAINTLLEANGLLDTWIGHFVVGRAYLDAGAFAQADSEFDRCIRRRGEALALFLDEEPTYGIMAGVYYYQGLAREGLKTAGFAESYRTYLRIRGKSTEDPLVTDARKRLRG